MNTTASILDRVAQLSRRIGPEFAAMAVAIDVGQGYPAGWGTSPRRAPADTSHKPSPAASYKPAHGGYPGTPVLDNAKQAR